MPLWTKVSGPDARADRTMCARPSSIVSVVDYGASITKGRSD